MVKSRAPCFAPPPPAPDCDADVIVVGGGVSGLRAAQQLKLKYGLRVIVLEARDKAGGCVPPCAFSTLPPCACPPPPPRTLLTAPPPRTQHKNTAALSW